MTQSRDHLSVKPTGKTMFFLAFVGEQKSRKIAIEQQVIDEDLQRRAKAINAFIKRMSY